MNERESIRDAVSGTALANFELQPVAVLDTDQVAFCWEVPVADAHALWRQARSHAETLGRWPLLVLEPFYPDTFNRSFYGDTDDQSPAALERDSHDVATSLLGHLERAIARSRLHRGHVGPLPSLTRSSRSPRPARASPYYRGSAGDGDRRGRDGGGRRERQMRR